MLIFYYYLQTIFVDMKIFIWYLIKLQKGWAVNHLEKRGGATAHKPLPWECVLEKLREKI